MKNNIEFIDYAKSMIGHPYIFGTYGLKLTEAIINQKGRDYPSQMTAKRCEYAKAHYIGKTSVDCSGLFKAFIWGAPESTPKYNASSDWNAKMIYQKASEKGTIDTMPKDIVGICLFNKSFSHVATWDGEKIVEAKGFDYGVVEGKSKLSSFAYWAKHPLIEYIGEKPDQPHNSNSEKTDSDIERVARLVIAGQYGNGTERKKNLEAAGFDYNRVQAKVNEMLKSVSAKRTIKTVKVSDYLNVRLYPNGTIIGSLRNGTKIEILSDVNGWSKISFNGKIAYISSKYLN